MNGVDASEKSGREQSGFLVRVPWTRLWRRVGDTSQRIGVWPIVPLYSLLSNEAHLRLDYISARRRCWLGRTLIFGIPRCMMTLHLTLSHSLTRILATSAIL